jgi:sec-independent protein translocase protein TatC
MPSPKPTDQMSWVEHLEELRSRLIVCIIAICITTALAFLVSDNLIVLLKIPAGNIILHVFGPMDGFFVKWRISLFSGVALAFPVWSYEIISYISPGLTTQEKRVILPLVFVAFILFLIGVAFGYYLLFGMIGVLVAMFGTQLEYFPAADAYMSFASFFLLSTGLAFEMPVVLYALVQLHILSVELLKKQRRYFYFAMFVFAEIITPVSDPIIAPLTITLPMVLLYELTIIVASLGKRSKQRIPASLSSGNTSLKV